MMDYARESVHTHEGPISCSTLDYIMLPNDMSDNINNYMVKDDHALNTSDHFLVSVVCNMVGLAKTRHGDHTSKRIRWDKLTSLGIKERYQVITIT